MDWFKGKPTGNHRCSMIFPLNKRGYCRFSQKPIHSTNKKTVGFPISPVPGKTKKIEEPAAPPLEVCGSRGQRIGELDEHGWT